MLEASGLYMDQAGSASNEQQTHIAKTYSGFAVALQRRGLQSYCKLQWEVCGSGSTCEDPNTHVSSYKRQKMGAGLQAGGEKKKKGRS